jgi:hypothetical protein
MIYAASGDTRAAAIFRLNFDWQLSIQWGLAANGASETRNRTQDAGDNVHFFSFKTGFLLYFNPSDITEESSHGQKL